MKNRPKTAETRLPDIKGIESVLCYVGSRGAGVIVGRGSHYELIGVDESGRCTAKILTPEQYAKVSSIMAQRENKTARTMHSKGGRQNTPRTLILYSDKLDSDLTLGDLELGDY